MAKNGLLGGAPEPRRLALRGEYLLPRHCSSGCSQTTAVTLNENETRLQLIDPLLAAAGWTGGLLDEEFMYRPGKLRLLGDQTVRDEPQFADYVLRAEPHGGILAIVEAKDESHARGPVFHQALAYAVDLGAPFAYSSNGHGIVEQDLRTGRYATFRRSRRRMNSVSVSKLARAGAVRR